jgi:hypothetical protein
MDKKLDFVVVLDIYGSTGFIRKLVVSVSALLVLNCFAAFRLEK